MKLTYRKVSKFGYFWYKKRLKVNHGNSSKPPIIFFGCSFTEGYGLKATQNLPYKITKLTGITTYNRGLGGNGPQQMLYELSHKDIFKEIPNAQYIIYIFMDDHPSRMKVFIPDLFATTLQPKYKIQNGILTEEKPPLLLLCNSFLFRIIEEHQKGSIEKRHRVVFKNIKRIKIVG